MWTTGVIADVLGKADPRNNRPLREFCFDTRLLEEDDAFVVLNRNADRFIEEAYQKGASCVIGTNKGDFIVSNSLEALEKLGCYARSHSPALRIAITGSAGKTSTKDFLYQTLSQNFFDIPDEFYLPEVNGHNVLATYKSFNGDIGIPLMLTKLNTQTKVGIFEAGSNHIGEIAKRNRLIQPHIAIITMIGNAHIGHFDHSIDIIANEKSAILKGVRYAILPADSPYFEYLKNKTHAKVISFGQNKTSDIRLLKFENGIAYVDIMGDQKKYSLPFPHIHHVLNILPTIALCQLLNIEHVDFSKLVLPEGRGKVFSHQLCPKRTVTIIDDSYNATYEGLKTIFKYFHENYKNKRKVAVLGDMVDLGDRIQDYHNEIARNIQVDHIITCEKHFAHAFGKDITPLNAVWDQLKQDLCDGDIVLFKGSHASNVHSLLNQLESFD